jgi:cell division protein ZapA (FtsZ GTPase activity inhibitor)
MTVPEPLPPQTTRFRDRTPSARQLDDLLLIELAIREQANVDEGRRPLNKKRRSSEFTANARALARAEGWRVNAGKVDASVRRLAAGQYLVADRSPSEPGSMGYRVRLSATGYARAAEVARTYLDEPLRSFVPETVVFDGIGQVQVEFLGERYVIGCIEGEEDRAIAHAHDFEVEAAEALNAVTGDLDLTRAMLMAGVLAHERIAELEETQRLAPASDRVVALDHNQPAYNETLAAIGRVVAVVRESNRYRETDAADQERRIAELEAGRRLLGSRWVSVATVKAVLISTLTYLASKFADAPIGEAATWAWNALKHLIGT